MYSSPPYLWCLSGCYGFHTSFSLCCPRPPPPPPSLVLSHSFARVQLCPLAEVAHLLSLGTDFKGPGHIWLFWRGYEAPRTLKAWGRLETITNRTAVGGVMDCCGIFLCFVFSPENNQSSLKRDTIMILMGGS